MSQNTDPTASVPAPDLGATLDDDTRPCGPQLRVASRFGNYELYEELARGGMGVVYRARQISLNRIVALKMILSGQFASQADVLRFRQEAEAAAALDHPNILPIYEVGEHEGQNYFSMKLVEGENLADRLSKRDPGDLSELVDLLSKVSRAIHYAHQRGVLHRDLKPANVLMQKSPIKTQNSEGSTVVTSLASPLCPMVTDFGLAKKVEGDNCLTHTGAVLGTPSYMSPEQARAERQLSTATDVYSLGAILYEILTGRPPFRATSVAETLAEVMTREPMSPRAVRPGADRDLSVVALKCLEKDPARRYESAAALADELDRWLAGRPIIARPASTAERMIKWARRRPAAAALLVLGIASPAAVITLLAISHARVRDSLEREKETAGKLSASLIAERRSGYEGRIALAEAERLAGQSDRAAAVLDECPQELRRWEWYHLQHLCRPYQLRIPTDLGWRPGAVAWLSAETVLVEFNDGLRIQDARTGNVLREFPGLLGPVIVSRDGRTMLCFGREHEPEGPLAPNMNAVRVWDLTTGRERAVFRHTYKVTGFALSPDGSLVASAPGTGVTTSTRNNKQRKEQAAEDDDLALWRSTTGELIHRIPHGIGPVAFLPDSKHLFAASFIRSDRPRDSRSWGEIKKYEIGSAKPISGLPESGGFDQLAISSDARSAAAINDRTVRVWDLASNTVRRTWPDAGRAIAFHPSQPRLAVLDPGRRMVQVWDVDSGRVVLTLTGAVDEGSYRKEDLSIAWSPDGKRILAPGFGFDARIWDATRSSGFDVISAPYSNSLARSSFSSDGSRLAVADMPQMVQKIDPKSGRGNSWIVRGPVVFDAANARRLRDLQPFPHGTEDLGYRPNSHQLLVLGEMERTRGPEDGILLDSIRTFGLRLIDTDSGNQLWEVRKELGRPYRALAFSPDGKRFALGAKDVLEVCDSDMGNAIYHLTTAASDLAWSPAGDLIAACSGGLASEVTLFSANDGHMVRTLTISIPLGGGSNLGPGRLAFSRDGRRLAFGSGSDREGGGSVTVWEVETGEIVARLAGHPGGVNGLAFLADSDRLVSGGADRLARVWDLVTGRPVYVLRGHGETIRAISANPKGDRIATLDGWECRVWDGTR